MTLFVREAIRALLRHRLRSALTALGITIGIAAVVLVVAIGAAGSAHAQAQLQALGDNLVWIEAGSRNIAGARTGSHGTTSLLVDDEVAILRDIPLIKVCSPQVDGSIQLIASTSNWGSRFRGETPDYLAIKKWQVVEGKPFSSNDVDDTASKILIGATVRRELFGTGAAVGEVIRANGQLFEVVGVLGAKGPSADGRDQDDWILLPYTTAIKKLRGGKSPPYLDDILCSAVAPDAVNPAIDRVFALMRQRHGIRPGEEDDFNLRRPDEVLKAQLAASETLALLLLTLGSIALVIGGIGIMNVMLASVAQRTREIGLRMAIGAKERDILWQFLGEAVVLSLCGGCFGVLLSVIGASIFERILSWPISLSASAILLAFAAASSVGMLFGFYPAWRAARLDPIVALRHE
ncbi:MAG TPA: ABC transporter permease [Polyangia bacterium]|nr:ABC transporter permease [Polyangia bacterium]